MKKIKLFLVVFIIVIVFTCFGYFIGIKKSSPVIRQSIDAVKLYEDKINNIFFSFPASWTQSVDAGGVVHFSSQDNFGEGFVFSVKDASQPIEQEVKAMQLEDTKENLKSLVSSIVISGQKGIVITEYQQFGYGLIGTTRIIVDYNHKIYEFAYDLGSSGRSLDFIETIQFLTNFK